MEHRSDKSVRLSTSVEPCPMCMGAIVMSPVRWVCPASRDPWAGSFRLLEEDGYMGGKKIHAEFLDGPIARTFLRLHLVSHLRRVPGNHPSYSSMERACPGCMDDARMFGAHPEFVAAMDDRDAARLAGRAGGEWR